jgi:biopolymer transport protein TolR
MAGIGSPLDTDEPISDINVTPLVDVALVLLIIFIVTSAIIVRATVINVNLPRAASAGEELPESVSVVLQADRTLRLDGEIVAFEELRPRLEAHVARVPELRALIAADRGLPYGEIMDIIDEVRLARLAGFSLNVEREPRDEP